MWESPVSAAIRAMAPSSSRCRSVPIRWRSSQVAPSAVTCWSSGRSDRVASECRCRSEEHTSELQSLMRISYAVFCLKKKKQIYEQVLQTHPNYACTHKPHHLTTALINTLTK